MTLMTSGALKVRAVREAGNQWTPAECPVLVALVALKSLFTACSEMFRVLQDGV